MGLRVRLSYLDVVWFREHAHVTADLLLSHSGWGTVTVLGA